MPILVTLDIMLAKRKMSLSELCEIVDSTSANLSILKTGKARGIRFKMLEAICEALDCQPADLLQNVDKKTYNKLYKLTGVTKLPAKKK